MPSFGRLGKSGIRPQHTVAAKIPPPLPSGVTAATGASTALQLSLGPSSGAGGSGSAGVGAAATGGGGLVSSAVEADSPPDATPPPALPTSALSSIESFVDVRQSQHQQQQQLHQQQQQLQHQQLQHQQQQQQPVVPPPHLLRSGSSTSADPPANSSSLDLHRHQNQHQPQQQQQQQQQLQKHPSPLPPQPPPGDFESVAHHLVTTQRYNTHQQQHQPQQQQTQPQQPHPHPHPHPHPLQLQQHHGTISTTSLDELSHTTSYHQVQGGSPQPPTAPTEKRSTRKLIKGIFAKATAGIQEQSHHNQNHNHNHGHGHSLSQSQSHPQSLPSSYESTGGLVRSTSKRSSRIVVPLNSIRQIPNNDPETSSSYDEVVYQPPPHPAANQLQAPPSGQVQVLTSHEQQQQQQQQRYDPPQQAVLDQGQSSQHYAYASNSPQDTYHQALGESHLASSYLGAQQNAETISQLSHDSPAADVDQRSINQQLDATSSAARYSTVQAPDLTAPTLTAQSAAMTPAGGAPLARRGTELDPVLVGPSSGYRSSSNMAPTSPLPGGPIQASQAAQAGQAPPASAQYRGGDRAGPYEGAINEQGRNSPQPSMTQEREAESEKAFKELLTKYKNVKRLYFDGKAQIEQLAGQIEHLQNAIANQRMSQSRTALDDSEYATRFNRLNGAINNLSFNIRKDWRCVPQWLEKSVSADALKTGKQEMTAVGRAVISRWIVEELFNKCFHPGLDPVLSAQLKEVELGIRGGPSGTQAMHSQEELDAHVSKVVNWRMATLEGLQQRLNGAATADNRHLLTTKATTNLTACLYQYLCSPPPHGVEGSTSMIVELAVGIAANLPMESRDVAITYPQPGDVLQPHLMEVEKAGLPPLDGQKVEGDGEGEKEAKDKKVKGSAESGKTGFASDVSRVRMAGFVALEVRGRQVLMKAPVWTF